MSRERTCPAALTAKDFALLRSVSLGIFSDVARANRPEVIVTAGQNAAMGKANYGREYSGQLGCRGSEPARQPTRLKGLPCYGYVSLGIFSDVAGANRPEVVVTAGQNAAIAKI